MLKPFCEAHGLDRKCYNSQQYIVYWIAIRLKGWLTMEIALTDSFGIGCAIEIPS